MLYRFLLVLSIVCELTHLLLHTKVFLGVGKPYSVLELERKRTYFVADATSVLVSFLWMVWGDALTWTDKLYLYLITMVHCSLHLYYITRWNRNDAPSVIAIRQWSAEKSWKRRIECNGWTIMLYNTVGTLFDIYVHWIMVHALYVQLVS